MLNRTVARWAWRGLSPCQIVTARMVPMLVIGLCLVLPISSGSYPECREGEKGVDWLDSFHKRSCSGESLLAQAGVQRGRLHWDWKHLPQGSQTQVRYLVSCGVDGKHYQSDAKHYQSGAATRGEKSVGWGGWEVGLRLSVPGSHIGDNHSSYYTHTDDNWVS